jgi:DNA-binding transcriptional ArsR family regulator
MTWPAITKHVKVLERAKLVRREQDGRVHRMHLEAKPMREARAWIDEYRRFWEERFDALDQFFAETNES